MAAPDNTTDHMPTVVERLAHRFGDWLKHRQELNEMRQLNTSEFDRIAGDLRVSPSDLDELVRHGPHAADELPQLLKSLGITEDDLARVQPMLVHDMERVCSLCANKRECDRDLAAGTSAEHYQGYCPNTSTIAEFSKAASK